MKKVKPSSAARARSPRYVLQLKIALRHITPLIWRRVLVPDDLTPGDLHYVIYRAMGWDGSHMHDFRFGGGFKPVIYAGTMAVQEGGPTIRHEDAVTLAQLIKRKGQVFTYEYDFGDGWQHRVLVEKMIPLESSMLLPVCVAGARTCPPEDCGGVPGYARVLRVLQEAVSEDDRRFRDWVGKSDPEHFDLDEINRRLQPRPVPVTPDYLQQDVPTRLLKNG